MVEPVPQIEGYTARVVPGFRAHSTYVCPACGNAVGVGDGHVVAWPDDRVDDRRHWHRHCWRVAARRGRIA